jgi:K+-transporting ATPase ATPase C chain
MNQTNKPHTLLTHLRISVIATLTLAVIVSGIYPLIVTGLAQLFFHDKANGSLILDKSGQVVGSRLIGQNFSDPKYFHPRPSHNGYDPTNTGGSNLGPLSKKLIAGTTKPVPATQPGAKPTEAVDFDGIQLRIVHYVLDNEIEYDISQPLANFQDDKKNLDDTKLIDAFNADSPLVFTPRQPIPADAVTGSGSDLDPHISVENALIQAPRIVKARNGHVPLETVKKLIDENTDGRGLGILGEPGVNVVTLNLALDQK